MECAGEMGISCIKEMSGVIDWQFNGIKSKIKFSSYFALLCCIHSKHFIFHISHFIFLNISYSPFWGWPSGTPASILMEPGLIYSIHGGHPIKASMEDPVNMGCQQQRRVNWGSKIHHSDILPYDTQDCLCKVWNWLKWGNVHCLCLYITWTWIWFYITYILSDIFQKMAELHFKCYS